MLALGAGLLLLTPQITGAESRTLYKPADIQNALQNVERHGWAREILDGWQRDAEYALQQDRLFFDDIIPELTPGTHYGNSCPHCLGKQSLMGAGRFSWSVTDPDKITCQACGTVYPNEDYPETGVLECPRMGQTFTYYETPGERENPDDRASYALRWLGDRPKMTTFAGIVRDRKVGWAGRQAITLAKVYALTGDIACAERAAWILDRFARVFPGYLYHSYDGSFADLPPAEVSANMGVHGGGGRFPRGAIRHAYGLNEDDGGSWLHNGFWGAGRLSTHGKGSGAGALLSMTVALDLIGDATHPDGRAVVDDRMRERIVRDLLVPGCEDTEHWDNLTNLGVVTFSLSGAVGLLLDQPDRVHRAIDGLNRMMDERYHFDGFYAETPAYAITNFGTVRELPDLLLGYSSPPGYQPETGQRVEDLDPFAGGHFHLAMLSMVRLLAPGNRLPVIGDTHYDTQANVSFVDVLAARLGGPNASLLEALQGESLSEKGSEYALWYRPADLRAEGQAELPLRSEWFPGWHVGVLRGGGEQNDTALYFDGNENERTLHTNHRHRDVLSIIAYAFGEELISDRGYFSGSAQLTPDGRSGQLWCRSTLSHNLVVVDEGDQASRGCGSDLELFGVAPGIEVVQATGVDVYPQCDTYRRTCALIRTPEDQAYIVDLFRVKGGECHQYSFHCNGSLLRLAPEGLSPQPVELSEVWSHWVDNPRALVPEEPCTFSWESGDANLDLHLLNDRDTVDRIVITDAPGWREASLSEFEKPPIQQILAEHRADGSSGELETQYASVIVPYQGSTSPVRSVQLLNNGAETGAIAIEVRFDDRTDIIVSTQDQNSRQVGPLTAAGEFAFVSTNGEGRATQAYLLKGTSLACGDLRIELPEDSTTLPVRSIDGRTIHLGAPVPDGLAAAGTHLLARGPARRYGDHQAPHPQTGFEIESAGSDFVTVRDYPVFDCDEITLLNSAWVQLEP
jgi:hypothetical protein